MVINENGETLMMYRNKKWDLPKGKIEKDEGVKEGAIREVEEETGVKIRSIIKKLGKTYHTYRLKDNWLLKETHWYLMDGYANSELLPQKEEGIEKVGWFMKKDIKSNLKNSYVSIKDVFDFNKI